MDDEEGGEGGAAAREERRGSHARAGPAGAPDQAPGQAFYAQAPDGTRFSAGSFGDLHLSRPLQKACAALGYTHPTPIQVPVQATYCCLQMIAASLDGSLFCLC